MNKEKLSDGLVELKPTKVDDRSHRKDKEYEFDSIHVSDIDSDSISDIAIDGLNVEKTTHGLLWDYSGKPTVYINKDGVYNTIDSNGARRQAYYALSILSEHGFVSGFREV